MLTFQLPALHPLRHLNIRLGHPPISPPPPRSPSDSLALQPGSAPHHRLRSLPLPHPSPHPPSPRSLEPSLHRRDPHRAPINHRSTINLLLKLNINLENQRAQFQRRGLLLTTPPPGRRRQERSRHGDGLDRGGVPGYYGFLLVHAGHGRGLEFCFHGWTDWQRCAVLFRDLDAAVWRGCGAGEQDHRRGQEDERVSVWEQREREGEEEGE
jgi:hypothetical protein